MKTLFLMVTLLALTACSKEGGTAADDTAKPSASGAAAAPAAKAAAPQKGLEPGMIAIGYLTPTGEEGQCVVLAAPEAEKDKLDGGKIAEVAKALKADVVTSCPTDNVVGTCKAMGMLVNYSSPKYDKETAQKDCASSGVGKWLD
ncbi:hypothetical protein [Chondromyces crocatus]|uniref:Secreted protein n=1 Tax=Chondromyces crocatus TaxID=52 RepID=A0A0K1EJ65_CHOCO|nr:hypothetical protein [Chondromyces crocatus]AKT40618.1 uncharacterized protein CMC5_047740 [Chondromyces crocatus]